MVEHIGRPLLGRDRGTEAAVLCDGHVAALLHWQERGARALGASARRHRAAVVELNRAAGRYVELTAKATPQRPSDGCARLPGVSVSDWVPIASVVTSAAV